MEFLANIDIDDLDKGIAFYEAAFGLKIRRRFGNFGVEMLGGPAPVFLLVKESDTTASTATAQRRTYERHWTPVHLDFVVNDIEAAVGRPSPPARRWSSLPPRTPGATWRCWRILSATASA